MGLTTGAYHWAPFIPARGTFPRRNGKTRIVFFDLPLHQVIHAEGPVNQDHLVGKKLITPGPRSTLLEPVCMPAPKLSEVSVHAASVEKALYFRIVAARA
jgi:hypothetical protein